jgi:transcriptional regulator with XRE-family HTH domain
MFSGQKLREARKDMREDGRRVSQERFAELVGVSRRTPLRWEQGEVEPRASHLTRIAEVTGKPIGFFFDDRPFREAAA